MQYLALFVTTTASIKFRKKIQKLNIEVEAIPVPRKLSSSCGIAIQFCTSDDPRLFADFGIDKIYRIENNDYILIYEADSTT